MEFPVNLNREQMRATVRVFPGDHLDVRILVDSGGLPVNLVRAELVFKEACERWGEVHFPGVVTVKDTMLMRLVEWRSETPIALNNRIVYRVFARPNYEVRKPRRLVVGLRALWAGLEIVNKRAKV